MAYKRVDIEAAKVALIGLDTKLGTVRRVVRRAEDLLRAGENGEHAVIELRSVMSDLQCLMPRYMEVLGHLPEVTWLK